MAAGQQEAATKRITELEQSLAAAHRQIQRLQEAAAINASSAATETNSLGQVRPAPNPRQKKASQCNMTTSTTLPMGFEFAEQATNTSMMESGKTSASPRADSRRKSMSLEVLSTTNRSTVGSDTPLSSNSPLSTASHPSSDSESEVNYDTFSRKSGSIPEKPHRGIISCALISKGWLR